MSASFDSFKRELASIDKSLQVDSSDPTKHIQSFQNVLSEYSASILTLEKSNHLLNDALPKIIKTVLKRKYSNNDPQILLTKDFLVLVANFLTREEVLLHDSSASTLAELFDPNQPFYLKHGVPKPTPIPSPAISSATTTASSSQPTACPEFLNSLVPNESYLDCYNESTKKWEVCEFLAYSDFRTEIHIEYSSTAVRQWFSLETHHNFFAEMGTRSMQEEGQIIHPVPLTNPSEPASPPAPVAVSSKVIQIVEATLVSEASVGQGQGQVLVPCEATWLGDGAMGNGEALEGDSTATQATSISDSRALDGLASLTWRQSLRVGDLVDCQDPQGRWLQACILDLKPVPLPLPLPSPVVPASPLTPVKHRNPEAEGEGESEDMMNTSLQTILPSTPQLPHLLSPIPLPLPPSTFENSKSPSLSLSVSELREVGEEEGDQDVSMIAISGEGKDADSILDISILSSADSLLDQSSLSLPDPASLLPPLPPLASITSSSSSSSSSSSLSDSSLFFRVYARVAYLGFPEKNDEWVALDGSEADLTDSSPLPSDPNPNPPKGIRIHPFNSHSNGCRGENPIREDINTLSISSQIPTHSEKFWLQTPEEDRPPVNKDKVVPRDSYFGSFYYSDVLKSFAANQGFEKVLALLHNSLDPSGATPMSITTFLSYSTSLGLPWQIISLPMLSSFLPSLLSTIETRLSQLTTQEIRATFVESLEALFRSLETLATRLYGRLSPQAGAVIEPMWLDVGVKLLSTSFLNRRLAGLKLVGELTKRAQNALDYPNGVKIVVIEPSTTPSTSTSTSTDSSSTTPASTPAPTLPACLLPETVRAIPITRYLPLSAICDRLNDSLVLPTLFSGPNAHSSLVPRSLEILKGLARDNKLQFSLLDILWEAAGLNNSSIRSGDVDSSSNPPEIQLLIDLVPHSSFQLLRHFSDLISGCPPGGVSEGLVTITNHFLKHTRGLLLSIPQFQEFLHRPCNLAYFSASSSSSVSSSALDEQLFQQHSAVVLSTLESIHSSLLHKVWDWTEDGSGVSFSVIASIEQKFDQIFGSGMDPNTASSSQALDFPWDRQLKRIQEITTRAVDSLANFQSIIPAIKVLQAVINSFPTKAMVSTESQDPPSTEFEMVSFSSAMSISMEPPTFGSRVCSPFFRSSFALDLEDCFHIYTILTNVVIHLKQAKLQSLSSDSISSTCNPFLCVDFKSHIERIADFLHVFSRCSHSLFIPLDCVQQIWSAVMGEDDGSFDLKSTASEVESLINFLGRMFITNTNNSNKSSSTIVTFAQNLSKLMTCLPVTTSVPSSSTNKSPASGQQKDASVATRTSVCSPETMQFIYSRLLCEPRFIASQYYSKEAFTCTEKYHRWLTRAVNTGVLTLPDSQDKSPRTPFPQSSPRASLTPYPQSTSRLLQDLQSSIPPSSLDVIGLDVFFKVLLTCENDAVAQLAVKFLMELPKSKKAQSTGENILMRKRNLLACLKQLNDIRSYYQNKKFLQTESSTTSHSDPTGGDNSSTSSKESTSEESAYSKRLRRALLLLEGILDESSLDAVGKIRPHGFLSRGSRQTFNIKFSNNKRPDYTLQLFSKDPIGLLFDSIFDHSKQPLSAMKILFQAKNIAQIDRNLPLSTALNLRCDIETVMVNLTGLSGSKTVSGSSTSSTSTSTSTSTETTSTSSTGSNSASSTEEDGAATENPESKPNDMDIDVDKEDSGLPTTSLIESLPASILSQTPQFLDLLFDLLDFSEGGICDKIWSLISAIPTSPLLLSRWLHLVSSGLTVPQLFLQSQSREPEDESVEANLETQIEVNSTPRTPECVSGLQVLSLRSEEMALDLQEGENGEVLVINASSSCQSGQSSGPNAKRPKIHSNSEHENTFSQFSLFGTCYLFHSDSQLITLTPTPASTINPQFFSSFSSPTINLSISRLLYHLQIIEMILQPSASLSDWEKEKSGAHFQDLITPDGPGSESLFVEWPQSFLLNGGFETLRSSLCFLLSSYPNPSLSSLSHGSVPAGQTESMWLSCLSLNCKLLRGLMIRTFPIGSKQTQAITLDEPTEGSSAPGLRLVLKSLQSMACLDKSGGSSGTSKKSTSSSTTSTSTSTSTSTEPIIGPQLPCEAPVPPSPSPASSESTDSSSSSSSSSVETSASSPPIVDPIAIDLSQEWGWRLPSLPLLSAFSLENSNSSSSSSDLTSYSSSSSSSSEDTPPLPQELASFFDHLQFLFLSALSTLRHFSKTSTLFSLPPDSTLIEKKKVQFFHDSLLSILMDLLAAWECDLIIHPQAINMFYSSPESSSTPAISSSVLSALTPPYSIDTTRFLQQLMLGVFPSTSPLLGSDRDLPPSLSLVPPSPGNDSLCERVSLWIELALLSLLTFLRKLDSLSLNSSTSSPTSTPTPTTLSGLIDQFAMTMFVSSFQLRPRLLQGVEAGSDSKAVSYTDLFSFLSYLLSYPNDQFDFDYEPPEKTDKKEKETNTATSSSSSSSSSSSTSSSSSNSSDRKDPSPKDPPQFSLSDSMRTDLSLSLFQELRETHQRVMAIEAEKKRCSDPHSRRTPQSAIPFIKWSFNLLVSLAGNHQPPLASLIESGAVPFLMKECLGVSTLISSPDSSTDSDSFPILCPDSPSRSAAYSFLSVLCKSNPEVSSSALLSLTPIHSAVPTPTMWGYRPDSDEISSTGYVGLKNMGCTCYMNSLLQILFMIPEIREGVLSLPLNHRTYPTENHMKDDILLQLQRMFFHLKMSQMKSFSPDDWVYSYKDETGTQPINPRQQQDSQEFLQVLCDRFENRYRDLLSEIEVQSTRSTPDTSPSSSPETPSQLPPKSDIFQRTFGGSLVNLMIREQTPTSSSSSSSMEVEQQEQQQQPFDSNIREHPEPFVCISLDVKGSKGLEDSLSQFVKGSTISDYLWEEDQPRCNISKQYRISSLSDCVIFHLKRFELNFDTFLREKVNDSFPFPMSVDLYPYTKEGFFNQHPHPPSYYQFELMGVVVHTGTTDSGHYFSYIRETQSFSSQSSKQGSDTNNNNNNKWFEFNDSVVSTFPESRIESECFGGVNTVTENIPGTNEWFQTEIANSKNAYLLVYRRKAAPSPPLDATIQTTDDFELIGSDPTTQALTSSLPSPSSTESNVQEPAWCSASRMISDTLLSIREGNHRHLTSSRILIPSHVGFVEDVFSHLMEKVDSFLSNENPQSDQIISPSVLESIPPLMKDIALFATRLLLRSATQSETVKLFNRLIIEMSFQLGLYQPYLNGLAVRDTVLFFSISAIDSINSILAHLLQDFPNLVRAPLLTCSVPEIRMKFANFLLTLYRVLSVCENVEKEGPSWFSNNLSLAKEGSLTTVNEAIKKILDDVNNQSSSVVPHGSNGHAQDNSNSQPKVEEMDEDLLLALKMSQESFESTAPIQSNPPPQAQPKSATSNNSSASFDSLYQEVISPVAPPYSIRLLIDLTRDSTLRLMVDQWRKCDAYTWLLYQLALSNTIARRVFIQRDMISQIIDIFLGKLSTLPLHDKASRAAVPTSYLDIPATKSGEPTQAQKNATPDFTHFMDLLSLIVRSSSNYPMAQHRANTSRFFLPPHCGSNPIMTNPDSDLLISKIFYTHVFMQARYTPAITQIISHICFEFSLMNSTIAEALVDSIMLAKGPESVGHLFQIMFEFLSIPDSMFHSRKVLLFNIGSNSIFDILFNFKTVPAKAKQLCVSLCSLLHIIDRLQGMYEYLHHADRLPLWTSWIFQFAFLFANKMEKERDLYIQQQQQQQSIAASTSASSSASTAISPNGPAGPFLIVLGETEEQRESTWFERSQRLLELSRRVLTFYGVNPDSYLTDDIFREMTTQNEASEAAAQVSAATGIGIDDLTEENLFMDTSSGPETKKVNFDSAAKVHPTTLVASTQTTPPETCMDVVPVSTQTPSSSSDPMSMLKDGMTDEEVMKLLSSGFF